MSGRSEQHGWVSTLMLFIVAAGALLVLPGLLGAYAFDGLLHLDFDRGQLWTLGASLAGGTFLAVWLMRGFVWATTLHAVACMTSLWLVAAAHFGAHAAWAAAFLSKVFAID